MQGFQSRKTVGARDFYPAVHKGAHGRGVAVGAKGRCKGGDPLRRKETDHAPSVVQTSHYDAGHFVAPDRLPNTTGRGDGAASRDRGAARECSRITRCLMRPRADHTGARLRQKLPRKLANSPPFRRRLRVQRDDADYDGPNRQHNRTCDYQSVQQRCHWLLSSSSITDLAAPCQRILYAIHHLVLRAIICAENAKVIDLPIPLQRVN
jgi:hypothetical protein